MFLNPAGWIDLFFFLNPKFDILPGFAVVLQVFDTPLRGEIAKLLPIIFKSVNSKNLLEYCKNLR